MHSLTFYPQLLLRLPRYTRNQAHLAIEILLKQADFLEAIALASPVVYQKLEALQFNWQACDIRLQHTLKKYHRRMCYRATPFGAFASLGIVPWANDATGISVKKDSFLLKTLEQEKTLQHQTHYQLNPYLYSLKSKLRFHNRVAGSPEYTLTEIDRESIPFNWLEDRNCLHPENIALTLTNAGLDKAAARAYKEILIAEKILVPHFHTAGYKAKIYQREQGKNAGEAYACGFHKTSGAVDTSIQESLKEAITLQHALFGCDNIPTLDAFKKKFCTLYDRKVVPLLQALDPEAGIDYLAQKPKITYNWSASHSLVLQKWTSLAAQKQKEIVFDEQDLQLLANPDTIMPPGMMILFEKAGNMLLFKEAGGASASAIAARFSVFDEEIKVLCQQLCSLEQQNNPDVIFADLSFEGDPTALKINSRACLRDYEIPLFGHSLLANEQQIPLHDLYLVMHQDVLILRSRRLNKRIIPRINSAYNYKISDMPLLHFLGDLQFEGIATGYSAALERLFPGQVYYPPMRFKNIILSPAAWKIDLQLLALKKLEPEEACKKFIEQLKKMGMPVHLFYEEHDQRMFIKLDEEATILLLLQHVKNKAGNIWLKEWYTEKEEDAAVKAVSGGSYAAEYIAFLLNPEKVYADHPCLVDLSAQEIRRSFMPLQYWVYLKIYIADEAMNELLTGKIAHFVAQQKAENNLLLWHFLRYQDDASHLRLRFKSVAAQEDIFLLKLRDWIAELQQETSIYSVKIDTYEREIERYDKAGIADTEVLFQESSNLAIALLQNITGQENENELLLMHAISWLKQVLAFKITNVEEMITIAGDRAKAYSNGFSKSNHITYKFNQAYRNLIAKHKHIVPLEFSIDFISLMESQASKQSLSNYLTFVADIFHLHANRLFSFSRHEQEAKAYHCLRKYLKSELARQYSVNHTN